jgi:hypothetical protein
MKTAIIIFLALAILDAGYLGYWAACRSSSSSVTAANFASDEGRNTVGAWHVEYVRSVVSDYDSVFAHALRLTVLLVGATVLCVIRKAAPAAKKPDSP